jgi:myo-inositol 2-dehydrogenase/D-chiro-inositol 1-dehydrogenase
MLGLGIVGCGFVVRDRHLPALRRVPDIAVAAIADVDPDARATVAAALGDVRRYPDATGVLHDPGVDAIAVCVPPTAHADVALAALDAGKHVLVEKPLAHSLADADRIVERAASSTAKAVVGFNYRLHRFVLRARELIRAGALGQILSVSSVFTNTTVNGWQRRRDLGGGAILDRAVHHFDLWRFLLEDELEEAFATAPGGDGGDAVTVVTGATRGGIVVTALVLDRTVVQNEIAVYGTKGAVLADLARADGFRQVGLSDLPGAPRTRLRRLAELGIDAAGTIRAVRRGGDYLVTYEDEWRAFAQIVRGDLPPTPSVADGRAVLAIALAAIESIDTGRPARVA